MFVEENCKVGDIVLVREGKDDKLIAYNPYGKVLLPVNKIKKGYAKITKIVKEAEKYTLVEMENVIRDYYDDITYEEFKEVLILNGFKIGFDRPFETEFEYGTEHQILAYNINNGAVIVAETFNGSKIFNSIEVYCPNVNAFRIKNPLLEQGDCNMTVFNLCRGRNLEYSLNNVTSYIENRDWNSKSYISLWTYADDKENSKPNNKYDSKSSTLWNNTIDRILLANKEIENILGNCTSLIPVFKTRKE